MSGTSRISTRTECVHRYTTKNRYNFTTCIVAHAFRRGIPSRTHSAFSLGILDGYIRRMLDEGEGCPYCARRRWDFILQDSYWIRYMDWHACEYTPNSYYEERLQEFLRACVETAQNGCDLWEHIRSLRPTCWVEHCSFGDENLVMSTSSPRGSSSSASSNPGSSYDSLTQRDFFISRETSPEREITPEPFFFSSPSSMESDLALLRPSTTTTTAPENNNWLSRLRKFIGFYWHKFIYRPFVSLCQWFRNAQAGRLGPAFGSLLGLRTSLFHPFAHSDKQSGQPKLLEWSNPPSPSPSAPATPYARSVVSDNVNTLDAGFDPKKLSRQARGTTYPRSIASDVDNTSETPFGQTQFNRLGKKRKDVKDMWWKVMAKILLAEHRERRDRPGTASSGESTSRPYSPMSSLSPSSTESSFRAEDCFSPVRRGSVRSEDNSEDQQYVQTTTSSDSAKSEFDDQWYAEWFSQWVLESSRKLRSPESESRFSSYSPLSSRAQSPAVSVTGSNGREEETYIRTRPSTPTPLSSPTFGPRGRRRDRRFSISSFSGSLPSPTRHGHSGSYSPVYRSPSRRRSPSPFYGTRSSSPSSPVYRKRTPSALIIDRFPLPPSTLSPVFPTATSTSSSRPSSRASSRPSSPYGSSSSTSRPSSPAQIQTESDYQPEPRIRPGPRPTSAAETEDYLPNAHLLRFPATVSARLMMTAETLGVDEVGKRRLASQLQRPPTAGSTATLSETVLESGVEVRNWKGSKGERDERRRSEELGTRGRGSGFDWGFGDTGDGGEGRGGKEDGGYGTD